ncbi:MAG: hypothetical protein IKD69_01635 [Solobacterium sp.]|nr:hypothetical protein [Solobacterium sp.]
MFKKLLFTVLAVIFLYSSAVVIYRIYEPKELISDAESASYIEYEALDSYLRGTPESSVHYLFFHSRRNPDSSYIRSTILPIVNSETETDIKALFETVDITSLYDADTLYRLYDDWGIVSPPCFAKVRIEHGRPVILSTLEWQDGNLFQSQKIESWLVDNGVYLGPQFNIETVETPTPEG